MSMAFVSLLGSCFGPFAALYINSKRLFYIGQTTLCTLLLIITVNFAVGADINAFYFVLLLVFVFNVTMGTFTFAYCGAVCYSNQVSIVNISSYIVMMVVQTLFEVNQSVASNFGLFLVFSCATLTFIHFHVKPIEGLTFDKLKKMYFPDEKRKQPKYGSKYFSALHPFDI